MKGLRSFCLFLACLMLLAGCGEAPAAEIVTTATPTETTVRVLTPTGSLLRHMTFNILGTEEYPGFESEEKRSNIKSIIEGIDPDTFGVQETAQVWTDGLVELLDGKYAMAGGHSDPNVKHAGKWANAIYYKVDTFRCLDSGIYYPEGEQDGSYPSSKPGNSCSFALLERKEDGALIMILSQHLQWLPLGHADLADQNLKHYGEATSSRNISRDHQLQGSAEFGTASCEAYEAKYGKPVALLIGGDFNIDALEDSRYEHEYTRMIETMATYGLCDTAFAAQTLETNQFGVNWATYRKGGPKRLDYIFAAQTVLPQTFTVGTIQQPYEVSSDHLPVYLDYYIGQ